MEGLGVTIPTEFDDGLPVLSLPARPAPAPRRWNQLSPETGGQLWTNEGLTSVDRRAGKVTSTKAPLESLLHASQTQHAVNLGVDGFP